MAQQFSKTKKVGRAGLLVLVLITILITLNLKLLSPPKVVPASNAELFSAERAVEYLKVIAAEPHSSGTPAHAKVRDYILEFCKRQGLETELQDLTGIQVSANFARAGRAQNILARMKGTTPGKTILAMCHYDSQPNTPGAADDGAGVAALMEVIRMMKNAPPLKNDVLFLFTDLEEVGLLGAEAFVSQYPKLNEIELLLNFESRGNKGVSMTFEVSKNNRWLMEQFTKAMGNSFAHSIGYEIYKLMPNSTDFTMFRNTGIQGINSALVDGFAYYHSMADNVQNMDLGSLQNHGDILLKSLRHFGNLSFDEPRTAEDAIFFNPIGSWLVIYPLALDLPIVLVTVILFACILAIGIKKQRLSLKATFAGVGFFLAFLLTSLVSVWLLEKAVLMMYPLYTNFDGSNSYNAVLYLIPIAGIILLSASLWFGKKLFSPLFESYFVGGIFVLILILVAIKIALPTGAYLLHYPLIAVLLAYLVLLLTNTSSDNKPFAYGMTFVFALIPALGLWVPIGYILFVIFSHMMPLASAVVLAFIIPLLIPCLRLVITFNRWTTIAISILLITVGLILAHINSGYSNTKPLQTFLTYVLNADENKASWVSEQRVPDEWTRQFITTQTKESVELFGNVKWMMWRADAPIVSTGTGELTILLDTISGTTRNLTFLITADSVTNSIDITLPPSATIGKVNNRLLTGDVSRLSFWSIPKEGIEVTLQAPAHEEVNLKLTERKIGLPETLIVKKLPDNMIYGPGRLSNTILVRRNVKL